MFTVRKAVPADALGITIVNVYTWKTAYAGLVPEKMIDERIADLLPRAEKSRRGIEEGGGYLVGEDDGTVVGFCMFGACRNEAYPGAGEIYALYVLDGYQGQGAGRALFAAAAGALKAQGFSTLIVNCLLGNLARGFYERMGGAVVGRRTDDTPHGPLTENILLFTL